MMDTNDDSTIVSNGSDTVIICKTRHENEDNGNEDLQNDFRFKCFLCSRTYSYKKTLNHHLKTAHQICEENSHNRLSICCLESGCKARFHNIYGLVTHLAEEHSIIIEQSIQCFDTFPDFARWKQELEKETSSRYVFRSSWKKKNGTHCKVYLCNRSGSYKPLPDDRRKRKAKEHGTRKIGQECTARLIAAEVPHRNGGTQVEVEVILTHYGHDCDLRHVSFSKEERAYLQGKLAMGMSKQNIIHEIKAKRGDRQFARRLDLAKSKDLCNILSGLKKGSKKDEPVTMQNRITIGDLVEYRDAEYADEAADGCSPLARSPLHIEVVQDDGVASGADDDGRSGDEILQQVIDTCVALQGSLMTRDVSLANLLDIEKKLKTCLASSNTHKLRKSGSYPLDMLSVGAACLKEELDAKSGREPMPLSSSKRRKTATGNGDDATTVFVLNKADGLVTVDDINSMSVQATLVHPYTTASYYALPFKPEGDKITDFLMKTCTPASLDDVRCGRLLKSSNLNLPEDLQSYDRDILDVDLSTVLTVFDASIHPIISEYVKRQRDLWKCAVCCETREAEMIECNGCPRWYHFACVGLLDIPPIWTCSECSQHLA